MPDAESDLQSLYDYIAARSGEERAMAYIERIEEVCLSLELFPERGTLRDALRPGLRILGFERRVSIAFRIALDQVVILRVLYGGRDIVNALGELS